MNNDYLNIVLILLSITFTLYIISVIVAFVTIPENKRAQGLDK